MMKYFWKHMLTLLSAIFWIAGGLINPVTAESSCTAGAAAPPFLAAGVDPNLLLMIDNSASMYDLAYVKPREEGYCYDGTYTDGLGNLVESYDAAVSYFGYFDATGWYAYDLAASQFVAKTAAQAGTICSSTKYANGGTVCIDIDETVTPKVVTAFAATGNFLNWASASKLDIQKKILTGGKYDTANGRMVMESRGCLGRRFVKKIGVNETSSGNSYYLTLGIRQPEYGEKADASDDTTRIEIFEVTTTGFNYGACQQALAELDGDNPNLGNLKTYVDDCMGYESSDKILADSMAAFNHSLQECWYYNKHGEFQPGSGTVVSMKGDCEKLYEAGIDPANISWDDSGYVCYGQYGPAPPPGYVGRCWEPAKSEGDELKCLTIDCGAGGAEPGSGEICIEGTVHYCPGNYNAQQNTCNKDWVEKLNCTGGGDLLVEGWTNDDGDDGYACVEKAIQDYCGYIQVPQVIDPSDAVDDTGEIWNAPVVLIDSGVVAQLDQPLAVLKGHIVQATAPSGLIEQYADKIRMGAMTFNDDGSDSECSASDPNILYNCTDPSNRDGGQIISYIDQSGAHTADLVAAINAVKATSWTPLAEAMYNAIGYYTQIPTRRLHADDFLMDASHPDPITAWCQNSNILVITEGASTADLNTMVSTFIGTNGQNDEDTEAAACGTLDGSTFLDDLTYYAWQGTNIYGVGIPNQNIMTHIVIAGTMRATGTGECNPETLLDEAAVNGGTTVYQANTPADLQTKLEAAFASIREGAAAGSAASVISASRGGEGAVYQAIFWPRVEINNADPVDWIGEVHALHIDAYGHMYEDTNSNRTLDSGDSQVIFYYDGTANRTKACVNPSDPNVICSGISKNLDEVHYLWSAARWLSEITDSNIDENRTSANYISANANRYIFTWNDLDNDGVVDDATEILEFKDTTDWENLTVSGDRGPVPLDFGVQNSAEVDTIVNWVRGLDQTGLRQRQIETDFDLDGTPQTVTWRLGDVVHSTPIAVSRPAEGYHFIYRDQSYGQFAAHYNKRRHVVYFGGNDGMLHAVNGGFYDETHKKFCLTEDCTNEITAPELGAELWAYVPYNLLPHLKCLTDLNYDHKYFVDMKPRIFDVQIFDDTDPDHPGGWGTILVGGMRFGGARISAQDLDMADNGVQDYPADLRQFTSAYFIFDITNPEVKPELLGELTFNSASHADLGFTTPMPTVVPMKTAANTSEWYLVLGSGPTALDGTSNQRAKVAVFSLKTLTTSPRAAFQIPAGTPTTSSGQAGAFPLIASSTDSFVSDLITVDFDLVENYRADVVYFGTVEGTWGNWGGKVYRLITQKKDSSSGQEVVSEPKDWAGLLSAPLFNPWPLIDVGRPVTAAPTIGWDGENRWVYFGTGRFFDPDDKIDAGSNGQEAYYGIKEPQDCDGNLTWFPVEKSPDNPSTTPGNRGLLRVDQILVEDYSGNLSCSGGGDACLPDVDGSIDGSKVVTFNGLVRDIVGTGCTTDTLESTGMDGWYKEFPAPRERNLGQATLLGGLLTFTSYQPFDDVCLPEGLAYLYGTYYQTGTAWREGVFGPANIAVDADGNVVDRLSIGRGLAMTPNLHVGKHTGSKAFVQTSTGTIVEIPQPNLPIKTAKSGLTVWEEIIK
jgi:type IV pilus assembly protein PilY1